MAGGWGPNPDKQFITKGHQAAQAVIDTPAGLLAHGEDATKPSAPAYSWKQPGEGSAPRRGMDYDIGDSPGPCVDWLVLIAQHHRAYAPRRRSRRRCAGCLRRCRYDWHGLRRIAAQGNVQDG
jgi:hypothetical protein